MFLMSNRHRYDARWDDLDAKDTTGTKEMWDDYGIINDIMVSGNNLQINSLQPQGIRDNRQAHKFVVTQQLRGCECAEGIERTHDATAQPTTEGGLRFPETPALCRTP